MSKKITKATFKSFMKKNVGKVVIRTDSHFDGMYDCVMRNKEAEFMSVQSTPFHENNLGYSGVWLVGGSGNSFREYIDSEGFVGINVYNCCGEFTVAIKDPETAVLKMLSKQ